MGVRSRGVLTAWACLGLLGGALEARADACNAVCNNHTTLASTPCEKEQVECHTVIEEYDCGFYSNNGYHETEVRYQVDQIAYEQAQICQWPYESCSVVGNTPMTCGDFGVFYSPPPDVPLSQSCTPVPNVDRPQSAPEKDGNNGFFGVKHSVDFKAGYKKDTDTASIGISYKLIGRAGGSSNEIAKLEVGNEIKPNTPDKLSAKFYVLGQQVWTDTSGYKSTTAPFSSIFPKDAPGSKKFGNWEQNFTPQAKTTIWVGPIPVTMRLYIVGKLKIETKFSVINEESSLLPVGMKVLAGPSASLYAKVEAYINLLIAQAGVRAQVNIIQAGFYPGAQLFLNHPSRLVHTELKLESNAKALDGYIGVFARVWTPWSGWKEASQNWYWGPAWEWTLRQEPGAPSPVACHQVTCGDFVCGAGESSYNCEADCGAPPPPPPPTYCGDGMCSWDEQGWCGDCPPMECPQNTDPYGQPGPRQYEQVLCSY
jgi:hypothetical protein